MGFVFFCFVLFLQNFSWLCVNSVLAGALRICSVTCGMDSFLEFSKVHPGNATITKHSDPEVPKEEQIRINSTYKTTDAQRTAFEQSVRKQLCVRHLSEKRFLLGSLYRRRKFANFCHDLTLVLLNPDMLCICYQCRSRSVGFWRSQLIWICTVCHLESEFVSTSWIK